MGKNDKGDDREYWLGEFTTSTGEVVEPYKVLGVRREATTDEIKQAYRSLSRKYHPDGMRFRTILPGSCNNIDEVRDQWERIKLSYEILSRPKMRKRYDRKEFMADPAAAVQRAAVDAAVKGAVSVTKGIGKGLFQAGAFAFQQITKKTDVKDTSSAKTVISSGDGGAIASDDSVPPHSDSGENNVDEIILLTTDDTKASRKDAVTKTKSGARRRKPGTARGFAKRETSAQ